MCSTFATLQWNWNQNTLFSLMKMHLKRLSAKWWPYCPGGYELEKPFTMLLDSLAPLGVITSYTHSHNDHQNGTWVDMIFVSRIAFNPSPAEQNVFRHFEDDISNAILWMRRFEFWFQLHWSLFLRVQVTIRKIWFGIVDPASDSCYAAVPAFI